MQFRFLFLATILFISALNISSLAQKAVPEIPSSFPQNLGKIWRASGGNKIINVANTTQLPQANVYREYGLKNAAAQIYTNGKDKVTVEAYRCKFPAGAYGLWSFFQPADSSTKTEIYHGGLFIRLLSENAEARKQMAEELKTYLASAKSVDDEFAEAALPMLPTYLPETNKLAGTEKFILGPQAIAQIPTISDLKDVIDFTGGTQATVAEYNNGNGTGKMSVLLVEYQTPQFAADGAVKAQQHFDSLSPEAKQKRLVRRVGNFVIEAVNVSDPKAAEELLKETKYKKKVYWEGKNIAAVPDEYRPPDEWVVNETVQTGKFIAATFYGISVLGLVTIGLGLLSGALFFYWRRAKRRRLGFENSFGDAEGMTRLNLDDDWLALPNAKEKLLGKGE